MDTIVWTVIGTIAAILTSFGFVPQVRKMWKRRSVGDVSIVTFLQFTAGVTLWAIYGVSRGDPVIIGANVVTFVTLSIGLMLFYRYREKKAKGMIHGAVLAAQEIGVDPNLAAREAARGLVRAAAETGADVTEIAKAAVEEAVESTKAPDVQVEAKEVAASVTEGVKEATAEMGDDIVHTVRQAVSDVLARMEAEEESV
jgi:MtN3 and saliva related transmembrane protein